MLRERRSVSVEPDDLTVVAPMVTDEGVACTPSFEGGQRGAGSVSDRFIFATGLTFAAPLKYGPKVAL